MGGVGDVAAPAALGLEEHSVAPGSPVSMGNGVPAIDDRVVGRGHGQRPEGRWVEVSTGQGW